MTTRSNETTATFSRAFALSEVDRPSPAGNLSRRHRRGGHTRSLVPRLQAHRDQALCSGVVGAGRRQRDVSRRSGRIRSGPSGRPRRGMRRVSTQATAIVGYVGRLAGAGSVKIGGETVARAAYDLDGFATPHGGVTGFGELRLAAPDLEAVFGRIGVQLLTDDGRLLDLKFSEKELPAGTDAAHVDVSGDLLQSPAERRVGSTRESIRSRQGPDHASG